MVTKIIMVILGAMLLIMGVKLDNILIQMAGGFLIGYWATA